VRVVVPPKPFPTWTRRYSGVAGRMSGTLVHSHALEAVLAADGGADALVIAGFEMLKGIKGVGNLDRHELPVIENTPRESELVQQVADVLKNERFAAAYAILVRDHGAYIWGEDVWEAKRHAEVYHWLYRGVRERRGG
jgi:methylthioribulose-1-phosphate dehydratase